MFWSDVFAKIHTLQQQYKNFITDITVNETSLEDIFLQFSNVNESARNTVEIVPV